MIYEKSKLGIHEPMILEFGEGDIMISTGSDPEENYQSVLFSLDKPGPIGENRQEWNLAGKKSDDLPNLKLSMIFNCVESIDVVIEKLNEARARLVLATDKGKI